MRELYFVSPYRRSIRTIHFQYGFAGKNDIAGKRFILKRTSGELMDEERVKGILKKWYLKGSRNF